MCTSKPVAHLLLEPESLLPSSEETRPTSPFHPLCLFSWIAPGMTQQEPEVTVFLSISGRFYSIFFFQIMCSGFTGPLVLETCKVNTPSTLHLHK